jgi:hypothetical protein
MFLWWNASAIGAESTATYLPRNKRNQSFAKVVESRLNTPSGMTMKFVLLGAVTLIQTTTRCITASYFCRDKEVADTATALT